jgi:RNA polymerase sigma-70 factor, ECF subfamily
MASPSEVTQLLMEYGQGNQAAFHQLLPLVYAELHRIAKRYMAQQNAGHTLQTTALLHEAYLKLAGEHEKQWESRTRFFAVAATAMRHILVDHARAKRSAKRGGQVQVVQLEEGLDIAHLTGRQTEELIALDEALNTLAQRHPRKGKTVELHYFGGLSIQETAAVLGVSPETVMRDWSFAKAFLSREMQRGAAGPAGDETRSAVRSRGIRKSNR